LIRHFVPVDWTLLPTKRDLESVYITSEEFENGDFTLKTHPMFPVHITLGGSDLTTQQSPVNWICVWGKLGQGNSIIVVTLSFSKGSFFKCFLSTYKRKARVFKFPRFEERFRDRLVWMIGSASRTNQTAFSNFPA